MNSPVLDRIHETTLLALILFGPLAFGCVEPWSIFLLKAGIIALLIGARPASNWHPLLPAALIVIIVGALQWLNPSLLSAPTSFLPFTTLRARTGAGIALWSTYGALLWRAPRLMAKVRFRRAFLVTLLSTGFLVAMIGIIQLAHGNTQVYGFRELGYGRSPFGPYFNRGHAASLLGMSFLAGLGIFLGRIGRLPRDTGVGSLSDWAAVQVMLAFPLAVMLFALAKIHNRGSSLALAGTIWILCFLLTVLLKSGRMRIVLRVVLLLPLAAAAILGPRMLPAFGGSTFSIPYRLFMYKGGLRLLADFPFWGAGLANITGAFHPYKDTAVVGIVDHVHSDWLEMFLQVGLTGAAPWFIALAFLGWQGVAMLRCPLPIDERMQLAGVLAAALFFFLHGLVDFSFQIPANAVIFLLLTSCVWAQANPPSTLLDARTPRRLPWIVPALLAASLLPEWPALVSPRGNTCVTLEEGACSGMAISLKALDAGTDPRALRRGLAGALQSYRSEPDHPQVRSAIAFALWRLQRKADSQPFR